MAAARFLRSIGANLGAAMPWPAITLAAAVAVAGIAGVSRAQEDPTLDRRVLEISEQLRCPTCQAISVKDSEAGFSRQIRDKVRAMLAEGQGEEEIKAYFVARYGEWILRAPRKEGVGLLLWLLPGLALAGTGAWIGYRVYRGARRGDDDSGRAASAVSDAERERIERDLRRFEEGY